MNLGYRLSQGKDVFKRVTVPETALGPVRVEYGFSGGGRRAALVRIGRWF